MLKRFCFISLLFSAFSVFLFQFKSALAQESKVYRLSYKAEVPLLSISAGTLAASYFLASDNKSPTAVELSTLKRENIWMLDRNSTHRWSPKSAKASDFLWAGSFVLPGLLYISRNVRNEKYAVALMYVETMSLTMGVTGLVKELAGRNRPFLYNTEVDEADKMGKSGQRSFFSGHTSECAAASFFAATVYAQMHPTSRFKPLVWTAAAALPAATGILRYTAGRHFSTDVIVGYAVGAAIGMIIPRLHYRQKAREKKPELETL